MQCCSDGTVLKDEPFRVTVKESRQQEPLKFQLLSALGLKEYLVEKFVFSRGQPTYQIGEQNGRKSFVCEGGVEYPPEYAPQVTMIEDERHSIPAVRLSLRDRRKYSGTVVYSHGNSSDLRGSLRFMSAFAAQLPRFDYLVYDYTGYGRSGKAETSEQSVVEDLGLVLRQLGVPDGEVILWGFSLGAYPTVRVAKGRNFRGIILQSPLASVYSLFAEQLTPYSSFQGDCFSLLDHLPLVNSFLVIAHSRTDEAIPFLHGKTLFERYQIMNSNPFCFLLEVDGLTHNQMHPLLCSPSKNEVREGFHSYLKLMAEQGQLPIARVFQLQKNKYFGNLGELQEGVRVDTEDKHVLHESARAPEEQMVHHHSMTQLKGQHEFEMDDISSENGIGPNHEIKVKAEQFAEYFQCSRQARDETEVESIPSEQNIPSILE